MIHIFIVNPHAGFNTFADNLREKLKSVHDIEYFVFNTRASESEEQLVRRIVHIFENEKLRFYCCGGSGTLSNMLNGFDDLSNVEIAFYPCGLTNDFLKVFGKQADKFADLDSLIRGKVIKVDYIRTNHGVTLNALTTGIDTNIDKIVRTYKYTSSINRAIPYLMAFVYSILFSRAKDYEIYIDDRKIEGKKIQIIFANGNTVGSGITVDKETLITDGKAKYLLVPKLPIRKLFVIVLKVLKNGSEELDKVSEAGFCDNIKILRKDRRPLEMDFDGELRSDYRDWEAHVVQKGLNLVIPKEVKLYE